jgi:hypothetical protein
MQYQKSGRFAWRPYILPAQFFHYECSSYFSRLPLEIIHMINDYDGCHKEYRAWQEGILYGFSHEDTTKPINRFCVLL